MKLVEVLLDESKEVNFSSGKMESVFFLDVQLRNCGSNSPRVFPWTRRRPKPWKTTEKKIVFLFGSVSWRKNGFCWFFYAGRSSNERIGFRFQTIVVEREKMLGRVGLENEEKRKSFNMVTFVENNENFVFFSSPRWFFLCETLFVWRKNKVRRSWTNPTKHLSRFFFGLVKIESLQRILKNSRIPVAFCLENENSINQRILLEWNFFVFTEKFRRLSQTEEKNVHRKFRWDSTRCSSRRVVFCFPNERSSFSSPDESKNTFSKTRRSSLSYVLSFDEFLRWFGLGPRSKRITKIGSGLGARMSEKARRKLEKRNKTRKIESKIVGLYPTANNFLTVGNCRNRHCSGVRRNLDNWLKLRERRRFLIQRRNLKSFRCVDVTNNGIEYDWK